MRDFYTGNFGAARAHVYVVGRFTPADMEKAIRDAFSGWAAGPAPVLTPPRPTSTRGVHLVDRPGAVQSTLIVGVPVIDPSQPDYVPLVVTNTLLGGYFSSRMTTNLREDKGYTYSPFSQLSSRQRDTYWAQNADVTTAVTGPSLKEIFFEIDRLQAEPPTAQELQAVKNYAAGTFVLLNSTRGGIINQLQFVELHGLPETYLRDYDIYPDSGYYRQRGKEGHQPTPSQPLDDASLLYFVRTTPLEMGKSYRFDKYFIKEKNPLVIRVLKRERMELPDGTKVDCLVLNPVIDDKGMFADRAEARLWITDDERRIPVQIRSKYTWGTVTLRLEKISLTTAD